MASGSLRWIHPLVLQIMLGLFLKTRPGNVKVRDGSGTRCSYTKFMTSRLL